MLLCNNLYWFDICCVSLFQFVMICYSFFALFFLHSDFSSLYGINSKIRLLCGRPFSCATLEIDWVTKVNRQQTIELVCVFFDSPVLVLCLVLEFFWLSFAFALLWCHYVLKVALCFVLKWSQSNTQRSQLPKSGTGFWVITPVLIIRITLTFTTRLDRFKDIRTTWYPTSVTCYLIPRST